MEEIISESKNIEAPTKQGVVRGLAVIWPEQPRTGFSAFFIKRTAIIEKLLQAKILPATKNRVRNL